MAPTLRARSATVELRQTLTGHSQRLSAHVNQADQREMVYAMEFAERLQELMAECGISERALARQAHCDRSYVHLLKHGKRHPGTRMAQRLDDALGAGGELAALVPYKGPARRSVLAGGVLAGGVLALADTLLFGGMADEDRDRIDWTARRPSQVDAATVDSLAGVLAAQRCAEDCAGPLAVMTPVLAQLAVIEDLVRQARGPVRPALVNVAQQWAQFAAYLHRDTGDVDGDRARLSQALEWAQELGDRTMTATVFVQRGNMALLAGEIGTVIGLAQAAQRDPAVAVGQRADAADLEARGYAHTGDTAAVERKLGEAAEMAEQLTDQAPGRHPWLYWMSPDYFECARGATFGLLAADSRYCERAVQLLEDGYARLPGDQRSSAWAARNLAHLAAVHTVSGDADQAASVALQCAEIARVTASARLAAMLVCVYDRLRDRWPGRPRVADLGEALR